MHLKWPDFTDTGTLLIDVSHELTCCPKPVITVFGENYQRKDELHITVIGSKTGIILSDKINQATSVNDSLRKIFEGIDWHYEKTGPVHFLSRTDKGTVKKSIILLLDMPGITVFYQQAKTQGLIDVDIPIPPPHITLYTRNIPLGIGVPNNRLLDEYTIDTCPTSDLFKLCGQAS